MALAVVAHPDDVEFNVGGTVARWIDDGWRVVYVIVTRGDKGSTDPSMTAEQLADIREEEQRIAAAYLRALGVEFLGLTSVQSEALYALVHASGFGERAT